MSPPTYHYILLTKNYLLLTPCISFPHDGLSRRVDGPAQTKMMPATPNIEQSQKGKEKKLGGGEKNRDKKAGSPKAPCPNDARRASEIYPRGLSEDGPHSLTAPRMTPEITQRCEKM